MFLTVTIGIFNGQASRFDLTITDKDCYLDLFTFISQQ